MEKYKMILLDVLKDMQHAKMLMQPYIDQHSCMNMSRCNHNIRHMRMTYPVLNLQIDNLVKYFLNEMSRDKLIEDASANFVAYDYNDLGANRIKILECINNAKCHIDSFDADTNKSDFDTHYEDCQIKYHVSIGVNASIRHMRDDDYDSVDERYGASMTDAQLHLIKSLNSMCLIKRITDAYEYPTNYKDIEQIWDIRTFSEVLIPKCIDEIKHVISGEMPDIIDIDTTLYSIDDDISDSLKIDIIKRHISNTTHWLEMYRNYSLFISTSRPRHWKSRYNDIIDELDEQYDKIRELDKMVVNH